MTSSDSDGPRAGILSSLTKQVCFVNTAPLYNLHYSTLLAHMNPELSRPLSPTYPSAHTGLQALVSARHIRPLREQ